MKREILAKVALAGIYIGVLGGLAIDGIDEYLADRSNQKTSQRAAVEKTSENVKVSNLEDAVAKGLKEGDMIQFSNFKTKRKIILEYVDIRTKHQLIKNIEVSE